jgi:hypothetical protein
MAQKSTKDQLIERMALLRAIKHYQYDKPLSSVNTPHGEAIPMEWRIGIDIALSPYVPVAERAYAVTVAEDKLMNRISVDLTYALAGEQLTTMTRVSKRYRVERDWMLLCSPETFMRFAKAEPISFVLDPVKDSYTYDGLKLYRHNLPTDIFINTAQSYVYNLDCTWHKEFVTDDTLRLTLSVRGYWLITSPTAKELKA